MLFRELIRDCVFYGMYELVQCCVVCGMRDVRQAVTHTRTFTLVFDFRMTKFV